MDWYEELKSAFSVKHLCIRKKECSKFVAECSRFVANEKTPKNEQIKLVTEFCSNVANVAEHEKIDFSSMRLIDVCADPELTKLFRAKYPVEPSETILCPKRNFFWRPRLDCNSCDGDPWCIVAIL